jgi:HEAT repeat protein
MAHSAAVTGSNDEKQPRWAGRIWRWFSRFVPSFRGKPPLSTPPEDKEPRRDEPVYAQSAGSAQSAVTSADKARERLQHITRGASQQTLQNIKLQIQNANEPSRLMIIEALEEIGTEEAFDLLAQMLPDRSARVQQTLLSILTRAEPRALGAIQRLLTNPNPQHQRTALDIIIETTPRRYVGALCAYIHAALMNIIQAPDDLAEAVVVLLEQIATNEAQIAVAQWRTAHPRPSATVYAVEPEPIGAQSASMPTSALVLLGYGRPELVNYLRAFESLLRHIHGGQWGDQQEATKALHRLVVDLRDEPVGEVTALFVDALDDADALVRWASAEALGWMRAGKAVSALGQRVSDPAWTVQVAAIRALAEIGDTAALYWVEPALDDKNTSVQEAAVEALGRLGSTRHVTRLKEIMLSPRDPMVRYAAVESARSLRAVGAGEALTALLDEPVLALRWAAARALSELADASAVGALRAHLDDDQQPEWEDQRVCDLVRAALERINSPDARDALRLARRNRV